MSDDAALLELDGRSLLSDRDAAKFLAALGKPVSVDWLKSARIGRSAHDGPEFVKMEGTVNRYGGCLYTVAALREWSERLDGRVNDYTRLKAAGFSWMRHKPRKKPSRGTP